MYEPDSHEELMAAAYAGNGCTSCLATTHTADNCPDDQPLEPGEYIAQHVEQTAVTRCNCAVSWIYGGDCQHTIGDNE